MSPEQLLKFEEMSLVLEEIDAKANNDELAVVKEVFVTIIPEKNPDDPGIVKAKTDELDKWDMYDAYEGVRSLGLLLLFIFPDIVQGKMKLSDYLKIAEILMQPN